MLNNEIQLPIDRLLKDYPKMKLKIFEKVKEGLLAFQKGLIGEAEIEGTPVNEMDNTILENASKALLTLHPRMLYDIFDSIGVYISITAPKSEKDPWICTNNKGQYSSTSLSRIKSEQLAFVEAFQIAEGIL